MTKSNHRVISWCVCLVCLLLCVSCLWKIVKDSLSHDDIATNQKQRFLFYLDVIHLPSTVTYHFIRQPRTFTSSLLSDRHPNEFRQLDELVIDFPSLQSLHSEGTPKKTSIKHGYLTDLYDVWSSLPPRYKTPSRWIVWYPFDRVERFDFPILVKSRWRYDDSQCQDNKWNPAMCARGGSILLKLNKQRHFDDMMYIARQSPQERRFTEKKAKVVWRGQATGYGFGNNIPYKPQSRETLVQRYATLDPSHDSRGKYIDVGLTGKVKAEHHSFVKATMSLSELLEHKYVISMEGNDVATNLKCFMASQSVVMMPTPCVDSWFMECSLRPYHHYIPLQDDCSDVWEQFLWAESHPEECQRIIRHANDYVQPFLSPCRELQLQQDILMYYMDHFTWIHTKK